MASRTSQRVVARTSPFRLGKKEIYLPDFVVTLQRSRLPPQYATFQVPLAMNKLDLRDYLWHAYGVRSLGITTRILPNAVQESNPNVERPVRSLFRPAPTKKMTVLMDKPFVWPSPPEKNVREEQFNTTQFRAASLEQEKQADKMRKRDTYVDVEDRKAMREQAERLLKGREKWRPPGAKDGSWAVRKRVDEAATVEGSEQGERPLL